MFGAGSFGFPRPNMRFILKFNVLSAANINSEAKQLTNKTKRCLVHQQLRLPCTTYGEGMST